MLEEQTDISQDSSEPFNGPDLEITLQESQDAGVVDECLDPAMLDEAVANLDEQSTFLQGFGFNDLDGLDHGAVVLICPDIETAQAFADQGIPAVANEGVWTLEHGEHLGGMQSTFVFCADAQCETISKAVDGAARLFRLDDAGKDLGEFLRNDGDVKELYESALEARFYDHREAQLNREKGGAPISVADLMKLTFPPLKWIVPKILPEGLSLIAGPSKIGKSWLCFDLAIAVSTGGTILGDLQVEQGDVLMLALEDGPSRVSTRLKHLSPNLDWEKSRLEFLHTAITPPVQPLDEGGLDRIKEWADRVENPRLVVIDVLEKVRPETKGKETEYKALYRGLRDIHHFATEYNISVLVVHHTRKTGKYVASDPFESVSGSMALTSLPDAALILGRSLSGNSDATLYGRGRDLEEFEFALNFKDGSWTILGDAAVIDISKEQADILEVLREAPTEGYSPKDLAELLGKPANSTSRLLGKMVKSGKVEKVTRGQYRLPEGGGNEI